MTAPGRNWRGISRRPIASVSPGWWSSIAATRGCPIPTASCGTVIAPAVVVDTTVLVEGRSAHGVARASRRHVHADFRLVDLAGPPSSQHFTAQLATEIVMRALSC